MTSGKRKMGIVVLVIAFSLVLTLYAVLSSSSFPNSANPENSPVTIRVETDKPSYSLGEVIQMHVSVKNVGGKNITIGSLTIEYTVYNSSKGELFSIRYAISLVPITILPQTEFEIRDLLRWNTTNAAPGIYTIKVALLCPVKAMTEIEIEILS